jgi:predicted DsbA family dithiol-disulfide isomerase
MIYIEFWADYTCPFCYIGFTELQNALQKLGIGRQVRIRHRAVMLHPDAPSDDSVSLMDVATGKYGHSRYNAELMARRIEDRGETIGLSITMKDLKSQNTMSAHRMAKYAELSGQGEAFEQRLFEAYFEEGRLIANPDVLIEIAAEAGLNVDKAQEIVRNDLLYADEVRHDLAQAQSMQIQGVPLFVFDRKYVINGAQEQQAFEDVLAKAQSGERSRSIAAFRPLKPALRS